MIHAWWLVVIVPLSALAGAALCLAWYHPERELLERLTQG